MAKIFQISGNKNYNQFLKIFFIETYLYHKTNWLVGFY